MGKDEAAGRMARGPTRRRRVALAIALLTAGLALAAAVRPPRSPECRITGKIPPLLADDHAAICRQLITAAGPHVSAVTITFRAPNTVSAQVTTGVGGQPQVRPEVSVAVSDRAIGMDSIAMLARAIERQAH